MTSLLLLALGVVLLFAGLRFAFSAATPGRVAAFATRHGLELTPGDQLFLTSYLSHTRRWRVAGALAGGLVAVVVALPQERLSIELFPVLAGWFAGAVAAEFQFRPPSTDGGEPAVVPGWLLRVPLVLAVGTAGVTVLVLALGGADDQWKQVLGWCAGALACAAAMVAVDRHMLGGEAGRVRNAVAAHAIGLLTGVGSAVVLWCLAGQLALLAGRSFGAAATGAGLVWVAGGLVAARMLATGRAGRPVLMVAVLVVVTSAGWAGFVWWKGHPPYPAGAVRATATVRFTDAGRFPRDAAELGVTQLTTILDQPHSQQFIGRVDHVLPAGANRHDTYHVLVIDKRQNRLASELYDADGGGWNGFMSGLADRYDWLAATAESHTVIGHSVARSEVTTAADRPGPIPFVGRFAGTVGLSADDLMVVLVLSGSDNQIYWASRISG
jgi:hypothetical protein